jgi:hypothetical protein
MEFIDEAVESVDVDDSTYIEGSRGCVRNEAFVVIQTREAVVIDLYDVTEDGVAVRFETESRKPSHVIKKSLDLDLTTSVMDEFHPVMALFPPSEGAVGEDVVYGASSLRYCHYNSSSWKTTFVGRYFFVTS